MMDIMNMQDISYIDIDELGVHPFDWKDDCNDIDFDETANGYYGKEKLGDFNAYTIELQLMNNRKKFPTHEEDTSMSDDDNSEYEIDPETGEKIFAEVIRASSPALSSSNDKWIEEYLSNIESSSSLPNQLLPTTTATSEFLFETHSFSDAQTNSNWLSNYISVDEHPDTIMFPDQMLSNQYLDDNNKTHHQITSPIFIPLSNKNQESLMNMLSVSIDDEYSTSSNSNNSHRQRLFSSLESDLTTHDSELTFDGHFIETKLEKIEHDENPISHMFIRRSSSRTNIQGQQDEDTLHRYNIPLTLYDITQSSTEEYNRHLANLNHLNAEQMHIIKDIRRRGKNKIAAQNCRKRKASSVETLFEEVDELKRVKHELEERKRSYHQQIAETRNQYEYLHRQVLPDRQLLPAIIVK